jgi:hypothetical protein
MVAVTDEAPPEEATNSLVEVGAFPVLDTVINTL